MNIPDMFSDAERILFAGVGGGFDIYTALPLWIELYKDKNREFVFSNYNGTAKKFTNEPDTYPENELDFTLEKHTVYVLPKVGVKNYIPMYQEIVDKHNIDTIIAVDGGVDSLMHGDEDGAGTILEDFANLIAINHIKVDKFLVCAGFGAEMEEGVCHHHVLENISELIRLGGFLGSCSLLKDTPEYNFYKEVCDLTWDNGRKSHIQTKIISAVEGIFGDNSLYDNVDAKVFGNDKAVNYLSPLTSMYWFFDLDMVMLRNVLYNALSKTATGTDLLMVYRQSIDEIKKRPKKAMPW